MKQKKPGPRKGTKFSDVKRSPVGERIFKTRRARGLSQEELGEKVGLSKRMIAHYESSEGDPTIDVLKNIAVALSVTVSYLVGESSQKLVREELTPKLRKNIEKIQSLQLKDQTKVFEYVDLLSSKKTGT